MTVTPSHYDMIKKTLAFSQQNHQIISQNIANVNVPGYKTLEMPFEEFLAKLEEVTSNDLGNIPTTEVNGLRSRADGNNVELDNEIAKLNQNSLVYQSFAQILNSKLSTMKQAISGN